MLLNLIFFLIVLVFLLVFFLPSNNYKEIRSLALSCSGLIVGFSLLLLNFFNNNLYHFQSLTVHKIGFEFLNLYFFVGLDGISLFFFVLSNFLVFLCLLFVWDEKHLKEYVLVLISLDFFLLLIFSVLDIIFFYIFFESILIPMYLMIGFWGSRERKIRAVYLFFFYTLLGSLCTLLGLLYIYSKFGSLNYEYISFIKFSFFEEYWLWLAFFLSFACKIPLFPFHIWLPEAHVEAPTIGSVLLAGILLKLGVYGFFRFNLALFPQISFFFSPIVYLLSICGIISASLSALRQVDLKRIIAYSSIAHMNLISFGVFSFDIVGFEGSIFQSISHGFVSGALFLLIGVIYNRYHSRLIFYYNGLTHVMPLYSFYFLFFTLANIALPGTSSFIGEFLLLFSVFKISFVGCFFSSLGVIFCGSYSLWLYNKICFGNLRISNILYYKDIYFIEFFIFFWLFFLVLFMGFYPNFILDYLHFSSTSCKINFLI